MGEEIDWRFQSLVGTLKTSISSGAAAYAGPFQSLVGTLKTQPGSRGHLSVGPVSIPCRYAKN